MKKLAVFGLQLKLAIYTFSNKKDNAQQTDKAIAETTKFILDELSKRNICFSATDFK